MATTPRGYPIFTGGMVPAGPAQMQQLAEAIDADVTTTRTALAGVSTALATRTTTLETGTSQPLTLNTGWTGSSTRVTKDGKTVVVSGQVIFSGNIPAGTHEIGSLPTGIPVPPVALFMPLTGYIAGHSQLYGARGTAQISAAGKVLIIVETTLTAAYLAFPYVVA